MVSDHDRAVRILRNVAGIVLALIGLVLGLFAGFLLMLAQNPIPFPQARMSGPFIYGNQVTYGTVAVYGIPALGSIIGSWFAFPRRRGPILRRRST